MSSVSTKEKWVIAPLFGLLAFAIIGEATEMRGEWFFVAILASLAFVSVFWLAAITWQRVLRPSGQYLYDEGILGTCKAVYEKYIKKILYGAKAE